MDETHSIGVKQPRLKTKVKKDAAECRPFSARHHFTPHAEPETRIRMTPTDLEFRLKTAVEKALVNIERAKGTSSSKTYPAVDLILTLSRDYLDGKALKREDVDDAHAKIREYVTSKDGYLLVGVAANRLANALQDVVQVQHFKKYPDASVGRKGSRTQALNSYLQSALKRAEEAIVDAQTAEAAPDE